MRDATVKVLISLAAALLVYVVVTLVSDISLGWRVGAAAVVALGAWAAAGSLSRSPADPSRGTTASNIRGRNVRVRDVEVRRRDGNRDVASNIRASEDAEIDNVKDSDR